jgi:F420-non-reducing hydrogenase iron-sulfur subunit
MKEDFEPEILAFCCNYCAYAAADLAGSMRMEYPSNVKILHVPCTGRVDVLHLLRAVEEGIDGVLVAGCLEGNCHFETGNLRARKRTELAKSVLREVGISPERVEMYNLSAAMASRFVEVTEEFTERIRKLGPSPVKLKKGREIRTRPAEKAKEVSPGAGSTIAGGR